jgi:RNA polymerase sigma factor (sigma-70 family)
METSGLHAVIRHVRRVVLANASDEELLLAIASKRDEDAFEALLRRHGPMVWAVCRRVLRHTQDAEDAFQATFLVLIRKAGAIRKRAALPSWLHGVAYRTAQKARVLKARRLVHESRATRPVCTAELGDHSDLDFEVNALPEKYRLPVLLCELQGRTRKEAAELLKIPEGTLSSRLAAARKTLARRLRLRGACFVAGATAPTRVPAPLVVSTVKAVGLVMTGGEAAGVVSANALVLSQGVLHVMFMMKLKSVVAATLVLGTLGIGAGQYARTGIAANAVAADEPGGKGNSGAQTTSSDAELKRLSFDEYLAQAEKKQAELRRLALKVYRAQSELKEARSAYQDQVIRSELAIREAEKKLKNAQEASELAQTKYRENGADSERLESALKQIAELIDRNKKDEISVLAAIKQLRDQLDAGQKLPTKPDRPFDVHALVLEESEPKMLLQRLTEAMHAYDHARAQMTSALTKIDLIQDSYKAWEGKKERNLSGSQAQLHSKALETSLTTLGNQFQHRVPVKLGQTTFHDGNRIEILEIWGTKPKFETGGQYLVRAKYAMPTRKRGKLYFHETTNVNGGISATLDLQSTEARQGSGEFTLLHGMVGPGTFHLQLLANDGGPNGVLADVYFE